MIDKTAKIMECSRVFSLPMTILSWLVIFTYAIIDFGNLLYGIFALIGICFAHLGTNLLDDYFDYKSLIKQVDFNKSEYLKQSQKTKCRYIISGFMQEKDVLILASIYFLIAILCGLFLYLKCGNEVIRFALAGALIAVIYPFVSRICLSEIAVGLAFGPILFYGVHYVMTGILSYDILILSLPTMFMTIVLLYIHTVMDYEFDINEGKKTIANIFNSQLDSLIILKYLLIISYTSLIFLCIFDILDWQVFFVYLTIPMAIDLYKSMKIFSTNPDELPPKKWYHFPMENMKNLRKNNEDSFMIRIYQARNLMIYFSLILTISIILSKSI